MKGTPHSAVPGAGVPDAADELRLRATFELAQAAARRGNRPFGALIVDADGVELARDGSTQGESGDTTAHAEMNAVRAAMRTWPRERLAHATIYASSEPCAMCATAIFYAGISRIVFGASEVRLRVLRNVDAASAGIALGCARMFASAPRTIAVVGPCLEAEALPLHEGHWPAAGAAPPTSSVPDERADAARGAAHDVAALRRAIALATWAREHGELPFGAVITAADGSVLAEAVSTEVSTGDWTCHAETNAVRDVVRRVPHAQLAAATIHASAEPCPLCAAAIFYSGLRRVRFSFPEAKLRDLLRTRPETGALGVSCQEVFAAAAQPVQVEGPLLPDEGAVPHAGFWSR